jgi:predicted transcriptional regulator
MSVTRLEDKLDSNYTTLHHRISDLRDDLRDDIDTKHEKLVAKLDDRSVASDEQHKDIYKKISDMEKWRWMMVGAATVVGYVLAHIKLDRLL